MLPLFLKKNTRSFESSFYSAKFSVNHTYDSWHHHEELEFLHIIKGSGTRFIGDSIEPYSDGDIVLVGPNLPHVWRSDKIYYEGIPELRCDLILTQFAADFLGLDFLKLPEMIGLNELIKDSYQGLQIIGSTRKQISSRLMKLTEMEGSDKLLEFIQILLMISKSKEYRKLSSSGFVDTYHSKGGKRINKVHDFIMNNFMEEISLKEAADIAYMNETAFCRFFKTTTLKTFTQYLNEVRIGYACKLLLNEDLNIAGVGYECGFKNISYFNRVFKNSLGVTPQQYQKKHIA
ncbi:AraC family transcriptional regulator [Algoriphagus sp. D3-2-R+10]|uniref:AraC family transcriptional regulator n=1 Tax=Algoriphagus aurantiacus TaxID=3103948 RepID=UPI002B3A55B4|nr:AraC family transcriptional regulator [Algoriphagus sp. D3-2-R+10]MEB2777386.1 AraC family transcriptional regulator [Algoriphagus sp. D3-2-R+10]